MPAITTNGKFVIENVILTIAAGFFVWYIKMMTEDSRNFRDFMARGDRFTTADSHALETRFRAFVKSEYPPKWLTNQVARHERHIERHESRLDVLERKIP